MGAGGVVVSGSPGSTAAGPRRGTARGPPARAEFTASHDKREAEGCQAPVSRAVPDAVVGNGDRKPDRAEGSDPWTAQINRLAKEKDKEACVPGEHRLLWYALRDSNPRPSGP